MFFILIISLSIIIYQDFKERAVWLVNLLLSMVVIAIIHAKNSYDLTIFLKTILINLMVVIIISLILLVYTLLFLKRKFSEAIGLGDLIFFCILAVGFPTYSFLIIFCTSIIFSQIVYLLLSLSKNISTIPLAGLQSLFLIIILILNATLHMVDLYAM